MADIMKDARGAGTEGLPYEDMYKVLVDATEAVKNQMAELTKRSNISIVVMFEMQMRMNKLSQLSEMTANVMSAGNQAINSFARAIK